MVYYLIIAENIAPRLVIIQVYTIALLSDLYNSNFIKQQKYSG